MFLGSIMKKDHPNNFVSLHYRKSINDTLNTEDIGKKILYANEQRKTEKLVEVCPWLNDEFPHVLKRSAVSDLQLRNTHSVGVG